LTNPYLVQPSQQSLFDPVILSAARQQPSGVEGPTAAYAGTNVESIFGMVHQYWTYIITSLSGTLYIGMTNSIERRMWEHKSGNFEGFARDYHCNRLVYFEAFEQVLDAIAREKQLKGWRWSKKIDLIESRNPRWEDLAEKWGWQMAFPGESIEER
jgi:putative endonuclease